MITKRFKDQELEVFNYGEFKATEELPINEISECIDKLAALQKQCGQEDLDRLMSFYRDGKVGEMLGFGVVNTSKRGVDCKHPYAPLYLECKSIGIRDAAFNKWAVSFSNLYKEKVKMFQDKKVWTAISFWEGNQVDFIFFGQHRGLGDFFKERLKSVTHGAINACICASSFIKKYNFKIIAVSKSKEEVIEQLLSLCPSFENLDKKVIELKDFRLEDQSPYARRVLIERGL